MKKFYFIESSDYPSDIELVSGNYYQSDGVILYEFEFQGIGFLRYYRSFKNNTLLL